MRKAFVTMTVALVTGGVASSVQGSGFSVYEQGAKASAQAGAFTARADDPSAIFYNPAGIAQLDGTHLMVGANAIVLGNGDFRSFRNVPRFDSARLSHQEGSLAFTPTIYFTHRLAKRVSFGVGLFSDFGTDTQWDTNFEGRYIARRSRLRTATVNPTIAFVLDPKWSIALGADYVYADVLLTRNLNFSNFSSPDGLMRLEGDTSGWGGNFALQYRSSSGVFWGLSWRSQVFLDFDQVAATFENTPVVADVVACAGAPCFPDEKASGSLKLPQILAMGLGVRRGKWDWEFDAVYHDWQSFETLSFEFEKTTTLLSNLDIPQDWNSTYSFRLGGAWRWSDAVELRAGVFYDDNPVPDETLSPFLPDSQRRSVQLGYGYTAGGFRFDVYTQYADYDDNDTSSQQDGLNGNYKSSSVQLGIAGTWAWGGK